MQHQQEFDHTSNTPEETPAPLGERQSNTDPREQPPSQESTYRSYEEGYTDLSEQAVFRNSRPRLRGDCSCSTSLWWLKEVNALSFLNTCTSWHHVRPFPTLEQRS
jgi:hypothetical protein